MLISENIGEKIKEIREYYGISQKELCEGICSQAYISRLEKGEINISADLLYLISKRLGVELPFFFNHYNSPRSDYITMTIEEIRKSVRKRDYERADEMVSLELKNPLFRSHLEMKQFLLWHKGICAYHLQKGIDKALFYLEEALDCSMTTNKSLSERDIEILQSKAIILQQSGRFEESKKIFDELLLSLTRNIYISDMKINIRIYYNYARLLVEMGLFDQGIRTAEKGINYAKSKELLYLQGDLYFQMARCYNKMGEYKLAQDYYELAKYCYLLNNEKDLHELTTSVIDEITEQV
ncbi:helix-turn-helix domain-containing protein [Salirhabdus salicampi]|uniref:helix-turn-helix domain-containing protein n=1 Tax=Salirhabdus salicampi TaxID=476102 RepID=UPI0020C31276|nr:helix-turn-helix domain-containing protein [Salirhabdus salicampi]MCP8618121.1 helix-turn-helix transcriptional regulator [Salirhabdus salicampi]